MNGGAVVIASTIGPGWVAILIGGLGLLTVTASRMLPSDSSASKALAWLINNQSTSSVSWMRLVVVTVTCLGLVGYGIGLVATGH